MIDIQPMDELDIPEGEDAAFSVSVIGEQLEYQWQKDGVDINDAAGTYSGTTTDTLTVESLTDPDDEGLFRVIVSNPANVDGVVSNSAELSVCKSMSYNVSV